MNSIKKNNEGFTLIELLITIVIIGIVAVPFLNSFIQATNINVKARRLQNATLAAQDLAEEFKARPLSEILNSYQGPGTGKFDSMEAVDYTFTNAEGKEVSVTGYNMKNMQVEGANGEKFYVTVKLDPSAVVDSTGTRINGALLPMFSNLYTGNTLIIFKQYVEPDTTISRTDYDKITDIDIISDKNAIGEYVYSITMTIKYVNKNDATDVITRDPKLLEVKYSENEKHTMYLLAPVFDIYSQNEADTWGAYYCSDKFNIKYTSLDAEEDQKDFTFYLAEQAKTNATVTTTLSRFNPDNINITYVKNNGTSSTKPLDEYLLDDNRLKINTNVNKEITGDASTGSLTYDPDNVSESLFLMTVEVRYRSKNSDVVTTFSTTKEE